jgi:lysophospholipase L1-like esterase
LATRERREPAKTLVFVAFGDSLTVGYQSPMGDEELPQPAPYTTFLSAKVEAMLREREACLKVELLNRGVVGELTDDMAGRFDRDVVGSRPDAVIILGGSNDLGWGLEPPSVARNLAGMYDKALRAGIRPVACTVPSVLGYDEGIQPRVQLNRLIRRYSAALGIISVDLFSATADSAERLREEYSNDGLHLSAQGYEAMAETIFSQAVRGMIETYLKAEIL